MKNKLLIVILSKQVGAATNIGVPPRQLFAPNTQSLSWCLILCAKPRKSLPAKSQLKLIKLIWWKQTSTYGLEDEDDMLQDL